MEDIVLEILLILLIIDALCLIALEILDFKNIITYKNILKINEAIFVYQVDCINKGVHFVVDYDDIEDYHKVLYRLWDWGYTRILPKDKFEIIKPYIK